MRWAFGLLVALVGCHAQLGDFSTTTDPDAATTGMDAKLLVRDAGIDASPDAPAVAPDNACGVPTMQGEVGTLTASAIVAAQVTGSPPLIYTLDTPTPTTAMQPTPDHLHIELWDNYGAFLGGTAHTGTFTISGDEASYTLCGVCVLTFGNVDAAGTAAHLLMAKSGSVTIHKVGKVVGGTLDVEVQNVTFQEIDPNTLMPITTSNCPSPLQHGRLDGTISSAP